MAEAGDAALDGLNTSLTVNDFTAAESLPPLGQSQALPAKREGFRGSTRRPNTQQSHTRPSVSAGGVGTSPRGFGATRHLSSRQRPTSPERVDSPLLPTRDSKQPSEPGLYAKMAELGWRPPSLVPPATPLLSLAGMTPSTKRTVQDWLKSGPAGERGASAASSEMLRPTSSHKYAWDQQYYSMLRESLDKQGPQGGLIGAIGANPSEPEGPHRSRAPDSAAAMQWFRESYPAGTPAARHDAIAARTWLDEQLLQLRRAVGGGGGGAAGAAPARPASPAAAASPAPSPSGASGGGGAWTPSGRQQHVSLSGEALPAMRSGRISSAGSVAALATGGLTGDVGGTGGPDSPAGVGAAVPSPRGGGGGGTLYGEEVPMQDISECVRETLAKSRDAAGLLSTSVLVHQEEILSRCMTELCGQVASSCLERGYLMHQLWLALRAMLRAMTADRDTARSLAVESRQREMAAMEGMQSATAALRTENEELTRMSDTLNKRLLIRQAEIEIQKGKVAELQSQLGALAGIKPELLRQQIADSNAALASAQKQALALNVRLERAMQEIGHKERDVQLMTVKLLEAQDESIAATVELQCRTPRPAPPSHPPWDLLDEDQVAMCMRALREGCSPEDLHRLLIGVSVSGTDLLPWFDQLLGCCRYLNPATPGSLRSLESDTADGPDGSHELAGATSSTTLDMTHQTWRHEVTSTPSRWAAPSKHVGGALQAEASSTNRNGGGSFFNRPVTRDGLSHTLGGGRRTAQVSKLMARRALATLSPPPVAVKELHAFLADLLQKQSVPDLLKHLPEPVVESVVQMLNHGADVEGVTCLLLGSMSYEGFDVTKLKPLAGALRAVLKQGPADVGGPITEALALACGSTVERVLQLEQSLLLQRRRALKLARAQAEQQQREDERAAHEKRAQSRKLQRWPHALTALFSLHPRAEFLPALGTGDDVPAVLRHDQKVFRSHVEVHEAVRAVRALWDAKEEAEAGGMPRQQLPDFLNDYMHRKYGKPKVIAETVYNLLFTCIQHQDDPDLYLFLKAVMGEVEDSMQEEQARACESVLDAFTRRDAEVNGRVAGWLAKAEVKACLRAALPHKGEPQLVELCDALDAEEPAALVKYGLLFEENVEGQQGVFAQALRAQHVSERLRFHQATEDALLDAAERAGGGADAAVTPAMVAAAVAKAHPALGPDAAAEVLARVFGPEATEAGGGGAARAKGKKSAGVAPVHWEEAARRLRLVPGETPAEEGAPPPPAKAKGKGKGGKGSKGKK